MLASGHRGGELEDSKVQEKILVVSIDFDGCFGNTIFTNKYQEEILNKQLTPGTEEYKQAYKKIIRESNDALIKDIQQRAEANQHIVVMVGSNRQSAKKDQHDAKKNKNGSCFVATEMFAELLAEEMPNKKISLDKYLVFDSIMGDEIGTNFNAAQPPEVPSEISEQYGMSLDKKYRLTYFQMQKVCNDYPNALVNFAHYDDRDDIASDIAKAYESNDAGDCLPPNLISAHACHYELFNPFAAMVRIFNLVGSKNAEESHEKISRETIEEFIKSLDEVYKEANYLIELTKNNTYSDEINAIQKKFDENKKLIESYKIERNKFNQETEEYKNLAKKISVLGNENLILKNISSEIEHAKTLKKVIENAYGITTIEQSDSGKDKEKDIEAKPLTKDEKLKRFDMTWKEFNPIVQATHSGFNSNIREHYLFQIPKLQTEYKTFKDDSSQGMLNERGTFQRQSDNGFTVDPTIFSETITVCMKDIFLENKTQNSFAPIVEYLNLQAQYSSLLKSIHSDLLLIIQSNNSDTDDLYKIVNLLSSNLKNFNSPLDKIIKICSEKISKTQSMFQSFNLFGQQPKPKDENINLVRRAIINIRELMQENPNITNLNELVIAQQKFEAINELQIAMEKYRDAKTNTHGHMKFIAYQTLINIIQKSNSNKCLAEVINEAFTAKTELKKLNSSSNSSSSSPEFFKWGLDRQFKFDELNYKDKQLSLHAQPKQGDAITLQQALTVRQNNSTKTVSAPLINKLLAQQDPREFLNSAKPVVDQNQTVRFSGHRGGEKF